MSHLALSAKRRHAWHRLLSLGTQRQTGRHSVPSDNPLTCANVRALLILLNRTRSDCGFLTARAFDPAHETAYPPELRIHSDRDM
jgi:hypothetical protein